MRCLAFIVALASVLWSASLAGQNPFPSDSRLVRLPDLSLVAPNAVPEKIRYGSKSWQQIAFYPAPNAPAAPVVIAFDASGMAGWPRYRLNEAGISLAVIPNREPVPKASKTIANYVAAIAHLHRRADELDIDRARFVLYGFGNDGSIATLFGTDPALLAQANVPFPDLRGVISVGGEDFDVARRVRENAYLRSLYRRYYGRDEAELVALSPVTHLAAPNAPAFLLLASEQDANGIKESQLMTQALTAAGVPAAYATMPERREGYRPSYFMAEEVGAGREVMPFLRRVLELESTSAH